MTLSSLAHRLRQDLLPSTYISQYVVLQKRGGIFMGLCPFHGEKTPSFHVHDGKKRYHCFGCGVHGDIFDFAKEYLGLSFREALDIFCQQLGYTPPSEEHKHQHQEQQKVTRRKTLHPLLRQKSSTIKKDFSSHQDQNIGKKSLQSFSNYPQKESVAFEENDFPGNQEIFSEDFHHQHQKNPSSISFSKTHKERLYLVLDLVRLWAFHKLQSPQGAEALYYVQKKRHISPKAISLFSLGYIGPEGLRELWDIFRFSPQELHEVGLLGKRPQGSYYNLFRHRLLFPIWDFHGRCIAFGGRDLSEDYPLAPSLSSSKESKIPQNSFHFSNKTESFLSTSVTEPFHQPKYLNSPQTIFFKKNTALYGLPRSLGFSGDKTLDFLKKAQQNHPSKASYFRELEYIQEDHKKNLLQEAKHHQQKDLFIVEGYFDVIGLFDAGFLGVAPLGTAFGQYHLQHLWSSYDEPIVCFDGDEAGLKAAKKVAYLAASLLKPGKSLRFISLNENLDPHSFLTRYYHPQSPEEQLLLHQYQGAFQQKIHEEFQDLKNKSLPLWLFLYGHIFQQTTPEGQVQDQEEWNKVLQSIPQKDIAQKYQALAKEKNFLDRQQKKQIKQKKEKHISHISSGFSSFSSSPSFSFLCPSSSGHSPRSAGLALFLDLEAPSVSSSFYRPPKKHFSKTLDMSKEPSQPSYDHYEKYQERLTLQYPQVDQQKNKDVSFSPQDMFHPLPYGFLLFLAFSYDFLQESQEECLQILQDHHKAFFSLGKQVLFSSLDPAFQEGYKHQGEKMQKIFLMMWEFMVYWKNRQKIYIILTPSSSFEKKDAQNPAESYESFCSVLPSFFQDFACFYHHFPLSWPRPLMLNLSFPGDKEPQAFKESLKVIKKNIEDYWCNLWNTYMMTSYQQRDIEALKTALRQGGGDQDLLWRRLQMMTSVPS